MSLPVGKVAIPALAAAAFTPKQTMTKKHSSSQMEADNYHNRARSVSLILSSSIVKSLALYAL